MPRKLTYSNITGTSPADFGIDTTRLERLKAELKDLETVQLVNWRTYLADHERYLAENKAKVLAGQMDPANVSVEEGKVATAKAKISDLVNNQIPAKKVEIANEQRSVDSQFEKQIAALREKAKTDPDALAALKELEAQQAAISGSKTKWIIFGIAGLVVLIVGGFLLYRKLKKAKAVA